MRGKEGLAGGMELVNGMVMDRHSLAGVGIVVDLGIVDVEGERRRSWALEGSLLEEVGYRSWELQDIRPGAHSWAG